MTEVWERYGIILGSTMVAVPLALAAVWALTKWRLSHRIPRRKAILASVCEVGAVVATAPWLAMLLTPTSVSGAVRLVPLVDLADLIGARPSTVVIQLGGNLAVFAAAAAGAAARYGLKLSTIAMGAVAASAAIEAAQYILDLGRVSSVDDILLNTAGAVLAACLVRPWRGAVSAAPITPL